MIIFYLVCQSLSLALDSVGSDESLDLGGNLLGLLTLLLDGSVDDVLGDGVGLVQTEELSDVVGSLGTESSGDGLKRRIRLRSVRFAFTLSVSPSISPSPFLTIMRLRMERLWLTMQPRTDFRFRSPVRLGL